MAIRPVDIRRKEFKGGFRGYDANQVDDFLDSIADEFERIFSENRRLAEEVEVLRGRLEQFEELEDSIRTALVHAEQVSRDLRQNASKEAELIVREAKERAHRILADSSGRVERVQESYEVLRKAKQDFAND
ncbi:MAG: DivIVA domain-containing protein, partial [Actinomycetota bacterium]|nr:DivIVA domain-containing protein [Actinomycetota bacterium]